MEPVPEVLLIGVLANPTRPCRVRVRASAEFVCMLPEVSPVLLLLIMMLPMLSPQRLLGRFVVTTELATVRM